MKKIVQSMAVFGLGLVTMAVIPARAAIPPATGYFSITYDTAKATATLQIAGNQTLAPSSTTLKSGARITLNGITGNITSVASVTASGFFGAGGGVTGVTAATNANLTGPITSVGNATTITDSAVTDPKTSLSTGAIISGKFGDVRVSISSGALTGGAAVTCTAGQSLVAAAWTGGILTTAGSCAASGSGDAVLASTQTFTGANNFTSSVTVTASKVRGIAGSVVASASPSGAATTSITDLHGNTDKNWRIVVKGVGNISSGQYYFLRFNADVNDDHYRSTLTSSDADAFTRTGVAGKLAFHLQDYTGGVATNTIHCDIRVDAEAALFQAYSSRCGWAGAPFASQYGNDVGGGAFWNTTSAELTSMRFDWGDGTFTGTITVYQD